MGRIVIEGMQFYAHHGHFEAERVVGNSFLVDLWMDMDCSAAAGSDNLNDALNYQSAFTLVKKEMAVTSKLLENVAGRILNVLMSEFPQLEKAEVKIAKMNPPMGGEIEKVSVSMAMTR